ncbi:hypothetical protein E1B28_013421 [Marasmius oreades]|uniref:Uncharacterized protein n=1 Tax=Marasmius oreades TaxID=181124 RepID=A0A9P7UMZ7_9AGAR|nr:uncharacterized protein E1B28_013421 [Marasmius oreades]KAG7087455.1 hypothetical protein E1B28_013421 [Marasmius oreades]
MPSDSPSISQTAETLETNNPRNKLKGTGSSSSDRAGASIFVKPHPKLTDLPSTAIFDTFPSPHGGKPVHILIHKRLRTESTETLHASPSLIEGPSLETQSHSASEFPLVLSAPEPVSPPSLSSLESDAGGSDVSMVHRDPETTQKKKKWTIFSRSPSIKKLKSNEDKDGTLSVPATPFTNLSAPTKIVEQQLTSESVHSSPDLSRSSTSNVLRKGPPPHLQLNAKSVHRPDVLPSQLHLSPSDLSKVNAYFAPLLSDTETTTRSGTLTIPRTPGGTAIPPHLFAPGHLVDRGQFLEQLRCKRALMATTEDVLDPLLTTLRSEKRPLSLVPELPEELENNDVTREEEEEGQTRDDAELIQDISVDAALAILYSDVTDAMSEDTSSCGFKQDATEGTCLYFTTDPEWEASQELEATCYFIEDPFPEDAVVRYADVFTQFSASSVGFERVVNGVPFDISEPIQE